MKKKYLNAVVVAYLAFISIFTIGITFQKIQAMKNDGTQEKMVIVYGDDGNENAQIYEVETPSYVSRAHVIDSEVMNREYVYELSERDYDTLLRVVEAEAGCEDENGKLLVANVVLNRVNSNRFPSTVYDVVYQAYNGRLGSVRVSEETKEAVKRALYGDDISEGALYFICSSAVSSEKSSWFYTKLDHVFDYGRHSFFK